MTNEADYEQFMKALGARIKQFRKERGLSMRDMIVKHGYHDTQWRRFERSGAGTLSSLLRIAKSFNTSVSILLDGLGDFPSREVSRVVKNTSQTAPTGMVPGGGPDRRKGHDRRKNSSPH